MEADSIDNEPQAKRQKIEEQENINETETEFASDSLEFMNKVENPDKYTNYVTPEELERLQEYKVLDEVKSNDEDSNDEDSESSDGKEDLPDEEIEKMLEEDLPDGFKRTPKPKEKPYVTRQKIVLQEKGVNHFEVLPLDWMMVRHYSGMPIYMHRTTRVCTLSKPYFLGKGNTRRHDIPISAIPCFSYRRALEEEQKQKEIDQKIQEQIRSGAWALNSSQTNFSNNDNQNDNVINGSIVKQETQIIDMEKVKIERNDDEYSINGNRIEAIEVEIKGIKVRSDAELLAREVERDENSQSDTEILSGDIKIDENSQSDAELLSRDIKVDENSQSDAEMLATDVKVDENSQSDAEILTTDVKVDENSQSDAEILTTDVKVDENSQSDAEILTTDVKVDENSQSDAETLARDIKIDENSQDDTINTDDRPRCPFNRINTNETSETQSSGEIPLSRQPVVLPGGIVMPPPRVESVNSSWKTQHLTPEQINDYCKRLFKFRTVNIMHFNRWADRRKYTKARKTLQYPTLPEGTKLITIPAQNTGNENGNKTAKRDWVMNMNGRCYLSVFHEYVYRALQKQPVYEFKQLENASTPYQATVYIGGMQYGVGYGSSKRQAKSAAARASIHILIPEMRDQIEPAPAHQDPDFSFFDYVSIEDPRISEFCAATCEPSPHAILRTCLLRNFGAGDRHIHTEMKKLEYQKIELTMKVGKHSATVVCKNKKTAKQRASQSILQALHPHVRSWGSLLRLYGSRSVKSCKEKKLEEQQITLLQDKARQNEPNYAVLEKLRNEMLKLRERDEAVVPIGTLLLPADLPPSASDLNHVQL